MMGERTQQSIRKASNARLPLFPPMPAFLDGRTKDFQQSKKVEWEEDPPIQPLQLRSTGQPFNYNPNINRSSSIYSRSTAESGSMQSFDFDLNPTVPATEEQHRDSYLRRDSHFEGAFQDVELGDRKGKGGKKGKYDEMSENSGEDEDDEDKDPEAFKNKYHQWAFLALMMITQIVTEANIGNTTIALQEIAKGLGTDDTKDLGWFTSGYACTLGGFILMAGRVGDLYGKKTVSICAWFWVTCWTLASGFCKTPLQFDLCRAFQGIGVAFLSTNAMSLIASAFKPGKQKDFAVGVYGASVQLAFFLGTFYSAWIIRAGVTWSWIFFSMTILTGLCAIASIFVIPDKLNTKGKGTFDYIGAALGVSALILIYSSINGGPYWSWNTPYSGMLIETGIVLAGAFILWEAHTEHPILPLSMFTKPTVSVVLLSIFLGFMGLGMFYWYEPLFLLEYRKHSELSVSLQFIAPSFFGLGISVLGVWLLSHVPGYVIFGGSMLGFAIGDMMLALQPVNQSYWPITFPGMLFLILGPALGYAAGAVMVSNSVSKDDQGVASSAISLIGNYSLSMGMAMASNLEVKINNNGMDKLHGYRGAFWLGCAFASFATVVTAICSPKMK